MPDGNIRNDAAAVQVELDPMTWLMPIICGQCARRFEVPYRHFEAGVVFHCRHCRASFVPKTTMCRMVREAFESFREARMRAREASTKSGDQAASPRLEEREYGAFVQRIERLTDTRPGLRAAWRKS